MRLVFMGTPEFAVPSLEYLLLSHNQVVAVYTQPDKSAGRSVIPVPSPVKRAAEWLGLPVVQPERVKKPEAVAQLAEFHPDVIVMAAYGQILPRAVLDIPQYGCLNVHPSLLPRFRGASPVASAILAGDEFTGVSIMLMDQGVDTGPVLARAAIVISPGDSTGTLTTKLSLLGARLLQEVLVRWLRREITPQSQNESKAIYCKPIAKEVGEIDWHRKAVEIWRQVRAYHPWPGSYTWWRGKRLKIVAAVPLSDVAEVGRVVVGGQASIGFGVGTGGGVLGVSQVQLEGKRVMSAAEFLRGQREFIGAVLPS